MLPPPLEAERVEVERERRVAGEVLLRKGHIERDCRRRDSMIATEKVFQKLPDKEAKWQNELPRRYVVRYKVERCERRKMSETNSDRTEKMG